MSHPEWDVREALRARAGAVPVGRADEAGLGRRLAAAERRRRAKLGGAALALLVTVSAVSLATRADGPEETLVTGPDTSSTTTEAEATTTLVGTTLETIPTEPSPTSAPGTTAAPAPRPSTTSGPGTTTRRTTTTTTAALPAVPDDALWPPPGSRTVFPAPERAADDFARRFLGMATPQLAPGRGSASGDEATVEVRPSPTGGLTTTVLLRRMGARGWVVVGCSASSIQVDQPAPGATVASPLTVRGRASAFEGTVDVEVRRDGATTPIGRSFGTGGGGAELLPFEATVSFARPSVPLGALVVSEGRADDSTLGPAAATVVRIRF